MNRVLALLEECGSVTRDRHFVYASGKHGPAYINLDLLFPRLEVVADLCREMSGPFEGEVDTVATPATGGIVLGTLVAQALCSDSALVRSVWADRSEGRFRFERSGFSSFLCGQRVLIVDDVLTTGNSVLEVIQAVRNHGGTVAGVSVICNRGSVSAAAFKVPAVFELCRVSFAALNPSECSLCANGVAIVEDIGHGSAFKVENPNYVGGYELMVPPRNTASA